MKRYSYSKKMRVKDPRIDAFIEDLLTVCKKHGMSVAHEDTLGAFTIETYSEERAESLRHAHENLTIL